MMKQTAIQLKDSQTAVTMRPIKPQDVYALLEMHGRLSADTIYSRYLRMYTPSYEELLELCQLPANKGAAFVVISDYPWENIIGMAYYLRYEGHSPTAAEPAVLIEDRFQGRGLGKVLMNELAQHARQNGVQVFDVIVHQANKPMLHLLRGVGPELKRSASYGAVELSIQLQAARPWSSHTTEFYSDSYLSV
jgi:GNAT superfamily N-acetyltransferase